MQQGRNNKERATSRRKYAVGSNQQRKENKNGGRSNHNLKSRGNTRVEDDSKSKRNVNGNNRSKELQQPKQRRIRKSNGPPPYSMILTAAIYLSDSSIYTPNDKIPQEQEDDREDSDDDKSSTTSSLFNLGSNVSTYSSVSSPSYLSNKSSPNLSTSNNRKTVNAWSKPLKTTSSMQPSSPKATKTINQESLINEPQYIYLLPRSYIQNWIKWASDQPVPAHETELIKKALREAAEFHNLKVPPNCVAPVAPTPPPPEPLLTSPFKRLSLVRSTSLSSGVTLDYDGDIFRSPVGDLSRTTHNRSSRLFSPTLNESLPPKPKISTPTTQSQAIVKYKNPGPIDASSISVLGYPLLLRPYVVVGKGYDDFINTEEDEEPHHYTHSKKSSKITRRTPSPTRDRGRSRERDHRQKRSPSEIRRKGLVRSLSLSRIDNDTPSMNSNHDTNGRTSTVSNATMEVGSCAVSEKFYKLLRSVHGVKCKDSISVLFQARNILPYDCLHHHVIKTLKAVQEAKLYKSASKSVSATHLKHEIMHPKKLTFSEITSMNAPPSLRKVISNPVRGSNNIVQQTVSSPRKKNEQPIPIEFRRRIIPLPMQQQKCIPVVEVYPVKLTYSIVVPSSIMKESSTNSVVSDSTTSSISVKEVDSAKILNIAMSRFNEGNQNNDFNNVMKPPRGHGRNSEHTTQNISFRSSHPPHGFILFSRISPAQDVLQTLVKAAAPDKSSACVRVWYRMGHTIRRQGNKAGATRSGNGYEILDIGTVSELLPISESCRRHEKEKMNTEKDRGKKQKILLGEWIQRVNGVDLRRGEIGRNLDFLIETRLRVNSRWELEDYELGNRISVGDFIDAQDSTGKWYESIVKEVRDDELKVHYFGWSSRFDGIVRRRKTSDLKLPDIAPLWTHTNRWRENLKVGDQVEVRDASSMVQRPRWFRGIVREISGVDDIVREVVGGADLEMVEDGKKINSDGTKKRSPLLLLERTQQVLVEVPKEKFYSHSAVQIRRRKNSDNQVTYTPYPPFLRWMNLYGEEICENFTHNSPENPSEQPATINYKHDPSRPPVEIMRSFNNIHGAGFVRESLRGVPPAVGSVGLHNLGNSCFMNSILQCLNHCKPLTDYFLRGDYKNHLNKDNPLGSGGTVALAYASLLNDMWGGELSTIVPRLLKQTVAAFAPQFNNTYQHDSHEFCSFLMDGLHEDLNRVKDKPYVEDLEVLGMDDSVAAIESWRKHLLRHDSIIVDHFQGMHRSHLTCPKCQHESVKFDVFSSISLPIPPSAKHSPTSNTTLRDCFDKYTSSEQLDENNAWYCSKCQEHVQAKKLISLWSTPDILILHIKRFTFDTCSEKGDLLRSKIDDCVNFPVNNLDMRPYTIGPVDPNAPPLYNLFAVSEHSGTTANSGHYTATVRNSNDGKWYKYNDSNVGISSGDASITGGAYLLFYQRIKSRSKWSGMEWFMENRKINPKISPSEVFTEVKRKKKKSSSRKQ